MRLIINKALDNINDNVNIKIIEIISTDFLNNDLNYFVYKNQIPLIKFTDTEEIFNVKNSKLNISPSLSETEIILDETDLELISGLGGAGGSQDLQSVLLNNPISDQYITLTSNLETLINISANAIGFSEGGKGSGMSSSSIALYESGIGVEITKDFTKFSDGIKDFVITAGIVSYGNPYVRNSKLDFISLGSTNIVNLKLPFNKQTGEYTVSTLEDILSLGSLIPTYATNAAAITGGLVVDNIYKTATGELRIVV